jgi:hypothetical protein
MCFGWLKRGTVGGCDEGVVGGRGAGLLTRAPERRLQARQVLGVGHVAVGRAQHGARVRQACVDGVDGGRGEGGCQEQVEGRAEGGACVEGRREGPATPRLCAMAQPTGQKNQPAERAASRTLKPTEVSEEGPQRFASARP